MFDLPVDFGLSPGVVTAKPPGTPRRRVLLMGGDGSGRYASHSLVEHSRRLAIGSLVRAGYLQLGRCASGGWLWRSGGASNASISLELDLARLPARYTLAYALGSGHAVSPCANPHSW